LLLYDFEKNCVICLHNNDLCADVNQGHYLNFYVHFVSESVQGKFERQLLDDLLIDYNPLERPVSNESDPLEVTFGISLQQIIDVVRIL